MFLVAKLPKTQPVTFKLNAKNAMETSGSSSPLWENYDSGGGYEPTMQEDQQNRAGTSQREIPTKFILPPQANATARRTSHPYEDREFYDVDLEELRQYHQGNEPPVSLQCIVPCRWCLPHSKQQLTHPIIALFHPVLQLWTIATTKAATASCGSAAVSHCRRRYHQEPNRMGSAAVS